MAATSMGTLLYVHGEDGDDDNNIFFLLLFLYKDV